MSTNTVRGEGRRKVVRSVIFNIDNGAGVNISDAILNHSVPIRILAAYILYCTENAGTIAGANVRVGTTQGGQELVASTAYTNLAVIGQKQNLTLVAAAAERVNAGTAIFVRHTGIAAAAAGEARVVVEYTELI